MENETNLKDLKKDIDKNFFWVGILFGIIILFQIIILIKIL